MSRFGHLFRRSEDVPEWASQLYPKGFRLFLDTVTRDLKRRSVRFQVFEEDGYWSPLDKPEQQMGLHNLVELCAQVDQREWPRVVKDHHDKLMQAASIQMPESFEEVKQVLKVRLLPLDARVGELMASYDLCPEFKTLLAVDLPNGVMMVPEETAEGWPASRSQLLDLALQNVWEQDSPDVKLYEAPDAGTIVGLCGDSFFISSHALMLDRAVDRLQLPIRPEAGMLVAVPTRDTVYLHVIQDAAIDEIYGKMAALAHMFYQQGPGPVTPTVLWWRDGQLTPLPCEITPDAVRFSPPPEFRAMLEAL